MLNEEQLNAVAASNNLDVVIDGHVLEAIAKTGHSTERQPWRGERADPAEMSGPNGSASVQSSM